MMMNFTEVMELTTGRILTYNLPPKQAVKSAYLQNSKNWNSWDYKNIDDSELPFYEGNLTVACGDFSAYKDGRKLC